MTIAAAAFGAVDEERVARHLIRFAGLSGSLDQLSQAAADRPHLPPPPGRQYHVADGR